MRCLSKAQERLRCKVPRLPSRGGMDRYYKHTLGLTGTPGSATARDVRCVTAATSGSARFRRGLLDGSHAHWTAAQQEGRDETPPSVSGRRSRLARTVAPSRMHRKVALQEHEARYEARYEQILCK